MKAARLKAIQENALKSKSHKLTKTKKPDFYIAGIGTSAGGLKALSLFFDNTKDKTGIGYIIVQHLDPTHKSLLSELIAGHTKMKVYEISDGVIVKPDCVYIIPPNKDLRIFNGALQLLDVTEARSKRRTIDPFFHSLAEDQKEKAIGIILSGTGTEGTLGIKEIKGSGGLTLVQDPQTAQFSGMPNSALASNHVDYILPPEKMPSALLSYVTQAKDNTNHEKTGKLTIPSEIQLKKFFQMIRSQTGSDFSNYKTNTILRRIAKRIALSQKDTVDNYLAFLQNNPPEIYKLYKDFLIGVTSFFRDPEVFNSIEKNAIPFLLKKFAEKEEIRIWVCGCSTGEEAYSLAILFKEALEKNRQHLKITIFATDIDKEAIDTARTGIYPKSISSEVTPERLSRYFINKENTYQLKKEIRELVVFAHHNVIKDPPFSKLDMISCRNLLIYMDNELQRRVIPIFHYSLNKEGILLLGTSENIGDFSHSFTVVDPKMKIYTKKEGSLPRKQNTDYLPLSLQHDSSTKTTLQKSEIVKNINISSLTEKTLLSIYAPPAVIIDKNNNVIYFSGNTEQYLAPPQGEASLNVLEMAKPGLKSELETAIRKARANRSKVLVKNIDVKTNKNFQKIKLLIKPILSRDMDLGALIIIFESDEKQQYENEKKSTKTKENRKPKISELEKELKITREHLQTAINELESSNENLQTTNEEYQSSNEELQSTNEELETSQEELQSVNEELITVNAELSGKIDQLSRANDDLNNLLSSIEVATIFLDRDLKIKRYTPAATKIFNLIPTDIDRPVVHLSSNIAYKMLAEDLKATLSTLAVKTADVNSVDGKWYHMRILPYRTAENIIEGVLITFVDITDQKITEEKLENTNEHLNMIMENLPAIPFTCNMDKDIKITFMGKSCENVTGFLPEQFTDQPTFWLTHIHPEDKEKLISAFSSISKTGSFSLPFRLKCANGKYKHLINFIRYAKAENGRPAYIVGVWQELKDKTFQ